ncbi:MAG: peptide chain release factor N(5)-glutamine methyltransferase [Campylobacterota bacterium]|nr:peptide chain release factor N(5)-glutamine methyltransferase [Campylobacterota bacterium]
MSASRSVKEWLEFISLALESVVENPKREAELLFRAYMKQDQLWLILHVNDIVPSTPTLFNWIERRTKHEPLEYITNDVSFYSQNFFIKEGALIPRPETELLIDKVLLHVNHNDELTIAEVGVGSGIISIILAQHLPKARFIGVDISPKALEVAKINIEKFELSDRIELREGSLLTTISEPIDFLVSNPPYIAMDAPLEQNLSYEPDLALFGGSVGDEIIKELLNEVEKRHINYFACEMGYDQKAKVEAYVRDFKVQSLEFYKDYSKFDRGFILRMSDD